MKAAYFMNHGGAEVMQYGDVPDPVRTVALLTGGAIRVPEITSYALSDAAAAHKVSEARHLRGKLVFRVR